MMSREQFISLLRHPNDPHAQFYIGEVYAGRIYVPREGSKKTDHDPYPEPSDERAMEWYLRAAEQGWGDAMFRIGEMYHNGTHPRGKSIEKAMEWYLKGAYRFSGHAMYAIGRMYHLGDGVSQSYERAMEWYLRAAEEDNAEAQYRLGMMYETGAYPERSIKEAIKWFERAAENGHPEAQEHLQGMINNSCNDYSLSNK